MLLTSTHPNPPSWGALLTLPTWVPSFTSSSHGPTPIYLTILSQLDYQEEEEGKKSYK